jgi:hypothetical protein
MFVRGLVESNLHVVAALLVALVERLELIGREITDVLEAAAGAGPADDRAAGSAGTIDLRAGRRARIDPPA